MLVMVGLILRGVDYSGTKDLGVSISSIYGPITAIRAAVNFRQIEFTSCSQLMLLFTNL